MNGPERYGKLQGKASESAAGTEFGSLEGLDPVTGLPVLIYDFEGEPLASPGDIDSENIPRILWSGVDEGRGRVVAALSPGWQRLAADSVPLTLEQLLEAAAALRAAAAAGVSHGDLAPWRLLLVGDRLQIEGYGVPWRPRPGPYRAPEATDAGTEAGDIWSLAAIVRELGVAASDETIAAVLEQCMAQDPLERPSADELFLALEALSTPEGSEAGDTAAPDEASRAPFAVEVPIKEEPAPGAPRTEETAPGAPRTEEPVTAPRTEEPARGAPRTEEPATAPNAQVPAVTGRESTAPGPPTAASEHRSTGPKGTSAPSTTARTTGKQRSSPPKGTSAAGAPPAAAAAPAVEPDEPEGPGEKRRRLTLLGALMAAVVILALLALYGPRGSDPPAPRPLEDVVYVVEVDVVPADLPPVTIHLIRVPEGSSLARSDSIGTAPRHLALDRAGTWAFQGSLQGRRSEVVEIEVPEERTVTLVMPEAGQ